MNIFGNVYVFLLRSMNFLQKNKEPRVSFRCIFSEDVHSFDRERYYTSEKSYLSDRIAWSPDGQLLASCAYNGTISLFDVQGMGVCKLSGHLDWVWCVAWSPDNQFLASSSRDRMIHIWDAKKGKLLHKFSTGSNHYTTIKWSPDETINLFAFRTFDGTVSLWDTRTQEISYKFPYQHNCMAWSPNGQLLASGSHDGATYLWNTQTGELWRKFPTTDQSYIFDVKWSPNGQLLASGSRRGVIRLWNAQTGELRHQLYHTQPIWSIAWSPDGQELASGSHDGTIYLWDVSTGRQTEILEVHTGAIRSLIYSFDGRFLMSKSDDTSIRLWRSDTWALVETIRELSSKQKVTQMTFNPKSLIFATYSKPIRVTKTQSADPPQASLLREHSFKKTVLKKKRKIHVSTNIDVSVDKIWNTSIWTLNPSLLLKQSSVSSSVYYTNAKVVLVGDTGMGKSGLSLVLMGHPFTLTESTHGRHVWTFDTREISFPNGQKGKCETLLWDMAGQPGYRLIHQLHLNEVTLAIVVFDARSETDPFAGVLHWCKALSVAQRAQDASAHPFKKFLVEARIDRGGVNVSPARINALMEDLHFEKFFRTSAKEGLGIADLAEEIRRSIDWRTLPRVSSTVLFQRMKNFLIEEKKRGRVLSTTDDLYQAFLRSKYAVGKHFRNEFETCIGRLEARDLIRRLSFGKLVLLQPELLDSYASALINEVKDEPDGLGSILEEKVKNGNFSLPKEERFQDKDREKLLLIAMIEDILRHEIALREYAADGSYLIFPSQSTREHPELPPFKGNVVVFDFEGPMLSIYTTLVVRLSHSGLFQREALWKNAVSYTTKRGAGTYVISLQNKGEGHGTLTIFFEGNTSEDTRLYFEEYISTHLYQRALPNSVKRSRIFTCSICGFVVTDQLIELTQERNHNWLHCPVPGCGEIISLLDRTEEFARNSEPLIYRMTINANTERDLAAAKTALQGKIETHDFDVFLCHNNEDKAEVKAIGEQLKEYGILPWLDEWELRPGIPWQRTLEQEIKQIKSVAVFIGKNKAAPWVSLEIDAFLRQFVKRGCPIIPVLLASGEKMSNSTLPTFLGGMTWVDFHKKEPSPLRQLIWGITGNKEYSGY